MRILSFLPVFGVSTRFLPQQQHPDQMLEDAFRDALARPEIEGIRWSQSFTTEDEVTLFRVQTGGYKVAGLKSEYGDEFALAFDPAFKELFGSYRWTGSFPNRHRVWNVDKHVALRNAIFDLENALSRGHHDGLLLEQFGTSAEVTISRDGIMIAPYGGGSFTETITEQPQALRSIKAGSVAHRLLVEIGIAGETGRTDDELNVILNAHSAHHRRYDLLQRGYLYNSMRRRVTRSGTNAAVWVVTPAGMEWLKDHAEDYHEEDFVQG